MKRIDIGIIGCGNISHAYLPKGRGTVGAGADHYSDQTLSRP
jgi:hypothetical protein